MDLVLACSNGNSNNKHEGNNSNKWLPELTEGSAVSLNCHFNTGCRSLRGDVQSGHASASNIKFTLGYNCKDTLLQLITLAIRISWSSMRIIPCLCGVVEMQK